MPTDQTGRNARIEKLIDDRSVDELRRATLQAVDHAYKSAAEVAEVRAVCEGALGTIAELQAENERLRSRVSTLERQPGPSVASSAWQTAQRAARRARLVRHRP